MRKVLITGANRGLGLGFVKHYLTQGDQVWASYRSDAVPLLKLDSTACQPIHWDVNDILAEREADKLPDEINLLINNAGIYGPRGQGQDLDRITAEEMLRVFNTNAVAPLRVVQALLPRLQRGRAVIANISSKMGSVSDNSSGGVYAYRAAKSALGIISRSMAVDLAGDGIQVIALHPGWVQTDMTNQTGLIDVPTSVAGLATVIDRIEQYPPGAFVAYDGQQVPY